MALYLTRKDKQLPKYKLKIKAGGVKYSCASDDRERLDLAYVRIINALLFDVGLSYPYAENANDAALASRMIPNIETEFS